MALLGKAMFRHIRVAGLRNMASPTAWVELAKPNRLLAVSLRMVPVPEFTRIPCGGIQS
jgi:hypothetical protein